MKILLLLFVFVLVGCQRVEYNKNDCGIDFSELSEVNIPDTNKQKYSEFITKSMSSCQKDCKGLLWSLENTAGELYGEPIYLLRYNNGNRKEKSISNMTDEERSCFENGKKN